MCPQILKRLPKAWFKPVGQMFINKYNQQFNGHLGPEWAGRSIVNILYHVVISMYNYAHPCFDKTAPAQLQVMLLIMDYDGTNNTLQTRCVGRSESQHLAFTQCQSLFVLITRCQSRGVNQSVNFCQRTEDNGFSRA